MATQKLATFFGILVLLLAFQNCSNATSFSQDGTLVAKNEDSNGDGVADVPAEDEDDDSAGGGGAPGASPTPRQGMRPPTVGKEPCDQDDDDKDHDHTERDNRRSRVKAALYYTCILEGPGNSVKLGYVAGSVAGGNSAANAVCVSARACREIASQEFKVKGIEKRGYCESGKSGAGRVFLSDDELSQAIEKMRAARAQAVEVSQVHEDF